MSDVLLALLRAATDLASDGAVSTAVVRIAVSASSQSAHRLSRGASMSRLYGAS